MSLIEYLARIMNTRKQEKEGLLEYTERFKQDNSTVISFIGENVLDIFFKQPRNLRNLMK